MRFRRRYEVMETQGPQVGTVVQSGSGGVTYRVAVAHTDPAHPSATVAHWGPAYNLPYADTASHILGVQAAEIDLFEEALKGAARARDEFRDGYEVWVERLDDAGNWEKVG